MNEKLRNYSTLPDPEVWNRIQHTMRRRVLRRRLIIGGASAALLTAALLVVVFTPSQEPASVQPQSSDVLVAQAVAPEVPQTPEADNSAVASASAIAVKPAPQAASTVVSETPAQPETYTAQAPTHQRVATVSERSGATVALSATELRSIPDTPSRQQQPEVQSPALASGEEAGQPKNPMISEPAEPALWIPNVFIPNGPNDEARDFKVRANVELKFYQIRIYNRAGRQVFESTDINERWNGTYRGTQLPQGAYVYVINYTPASGAPSVAKGTVTLVR